MIEAGERSPESAEALYRGRNTWLKTPTLILVFVITLVCVFPGPLAYYP